MTNDDVRIAEPCKVDWKKMTPAEGGRFCADCKKVVKNLSSMTEREARRLLRSENDGQLCVRYIYDAQGKIFFGADAPRPDVAPSALLSRVRRAAAGAALAMGIQACGGETIDDQTSHISQQAKKTDDTDSKDDQETDVPPGYQESMGGAPAMLEDPPVQADAGADADSDGGEVVAADAGVK